MKNDPLNNLKDMEYRIPKRIRLLKVLHAHLYSEVKETLATDKEIRNLKQLDSKVERYYLKQVEGEKYINQG